MVRTRPITPLPGSDAPQCQAHQTGKRLTAFLIVGNRQALRRPPGRSSLVFEVLTLSAGVAQGSVGLGHFLVVAVACPLQDLEGEVELAVAVGVDGAVFELELVVLQGEPGVGGLALVGLQVGASVGDPLAEGAGGRVTLYSLIFLMMSW